MEAQFRCSTPGDRSAHRAYRGLRALSVGSLGGGLCRRRPALLRNVASTRILDRAGAVIQSRRAIQGETKMHMKDAIKFALTISNGSVLSVIDEMSDAATTFPTPNGGCHPLWVLGHLTMVEGMIPAALFGDKNPVAEWGQYFGENSEPVADASAYPSFDTIRKKYAELREQNLALL